MLVTVSLHGYGRILAHYVGGVESLAQMEIIPLQLFVKAGLVSRRQWRIMGIQTNVQMQKIGVYL